MEVRVVKGAERQMINRNMDKNNGQKDIRVLAANDAGRVAKAIRERRVMDERRTRIMGLVVITLLLVVILSMWASIAVSSAGRYNDREIMAYVNQIDRELTAETRTVLNERGFRNSGVTVCCVIEAEGELTQTITIHHDRIDAMSEVERELLAGELSDLLSGAQVEFLLLE